MFLNGWLIVAGIGIGFIMSAPVGPVNFLCFHRALHRGLVAGLMVGLGAAFADCVFASAAVSGLTAVSKFIEAHHGLLQVIGGVLLICFGIYLLRHAPVSVAPPAGKPRAFRSFATGFALTITNPGSFFGFLATFSGLTDVIAERPSVGTGTSLIIGVALGAVFWWSLLTGLVQRLRPRITQRTLAQINKISGLSILISGFVLIARYAIDYLPPF